MGHKLAGAMLFAFLVLLGGALTACGSDDGSTTASDGDSSAAAATSSAAPTSSAGADESSEAATPSTSEASPSQAALPACGSVWKDGQKLPGSYSGCQQGSTNVDADTLSCSSGQSLVRFAPHYWAVAGGVIHRSANIKKDDDYQSSIARCRG